MSEEEIYSVNGAWVRLLRARDGDGDGWSMMHRGPHGVGWEEAYWFGEASTARRFLWCNAIAGLRGGAPVALLDGERWPE